MAALSLNPGRVGARPALDRLTWLALGVTGIPLVLWGAASVFLLARACGIPACLAWIPAVSTTGVMATTTRVSMRESIPESVRRYARNLAVFAISLDMLVSGLQHALPDHIAAPPWLKFFIGLLPALMGGATAHLVALVGLGYRRARAAEHDATEQARAAEAQRTADAELAEQTRRAEAAHARELARHEQERAAAVERQQRAQQTVTAAVSPAPARPHLVPDPAPDGPVDALGRRARPSEKRDAALRFLLAQHRDGRDLGDVTAAEVDREIGANGYSKKHLTTWRDGIRQHLQRGAA